MTEIQTVASTLWWLPAIALLCAAGCITIGLKCAYRALWLWRYRDMPIRDPVLAKFINETKPPPYGVYAAVWLAAGLALAAMPLML